jgi:thiol-disulfide isomerase/thioredoxin
MNKPSLTKYIVAASAAGALGAILLGNSLYTREKNPKCETSPPQIENRVPIPTYVKPLETPEITDITEEKLTQMPTQTVKPEKPKVIPALPDLTADNIDTIRDKDTIIDVWAPWCGPCKEYAEPFAEVAGKYQDKNIYFARLNLEEKNNRKTIDQLVADKTLVAYMTRIPCTLLLRKGADGKSKEIGRFIGGDTDLLEKIIQEHYLGNKPKPIKADEPTEFK